MTNYERIQQDKAFCAWLLASAAERGSLCEYEWLKWLSKEQIEVSDERTQEVNHG